MNFCRCLFLNLSITRFKVERTFGSIKRWFQSGCARYKGISKMHTQNIMEAMVYNLYRSPGIVMSNSIKTKNND